MEIKILTDNFWKICEENEWNTTTIAFYFYLLNQYEKSDNNKFSVSESQFYKVIGSHSKTIRKNRDLLVSFNLITIESAKGQTTIYSINTELISEKNKKKNINKSEVNKVAKKSIVKEKVEIKKDPIEQKVEVFEINIPPFEEVLMFSKTLKNYSDDLENLIEEKYEEWRKNGWKNSQGRPITDFKMTIKSIIPFLKKEVKNITIPNIKRP